jgi:hypothetical protein
MKTHIKETPLEGLLVVQVDHFQDERIFLESWSKRISRQQVSRRSLCRTLARVALRRLAGPAIRICGAGASLSAARWEGFSMSPSTFGRIRRHTESGSASN